MTAKHSSLPVMPAERRTAAATSKDKVKGDSHARKTAGAHDPAEAAAGGYIRHGYLTSRLLSKTFLKAFVYIYIP